MQFIRHISKQEDRPTQLKSTEKTGKIFKNFVKAFVDENEKTRKLIREENETIRKVPNELFQD